MGPSERLVVPELLDSLAPGDPRARRSRRDLRRLHRAMGSVSIMKRAILSLRLAAPPRRVLDLGAGDGHLTLRLARAMGAAWSDVTLTIVDQHDLLSRATRQGYRALGWTVTVVAGDVRDWMAEVPAAPFDLCISCLFLHHFDGGDLDALIKAIATNADAFVACEPRRNWLARRGSAMVGLLGANRVTREDAVKSVRAGYTGHELATHWPRGAAPWHVAEYFALPFTHCFTAVRDHVRLQ